MIFRCPGLKHSEIWVLTVPWNSLSSRPRVTHKAMMLSDQWTVLIHYSGLHESWEWEIKDPYETGWVLHCLMTFDLNKDIRCHIWPYSILCLQITKLEVRPWVKWAICLVITEWYGRSTAVKSQPNRHPQWLSQLSKAKFFRYIIIFITFYTATTPPIKQLAHMMLGGLISILHSKRMWYCDPKCQERTHGIRLCLWI